MREFAPRQSWYGLLHHLVRAMHSAAARTAPALEPRFTRDCPHNTAIEPDTGECLTCGEILP